MVLDCQLEVGEGNGDESRDNDKDDEDNEEDGVNGVHLVAPHAGKDVVQLDVDGAEWQEACKMSFKASEKIMNESAIAWCKCLYQAVLSMPT